MGALLSTMVRTRRGFLLAWLLSLVGFVAVTPVIYHSAYPDPADLEALLPSFENNLGVRVMYGRLPDPFSFGAMATWEVGALTAILGGLMALLLAVRLVRGAEEDGVTEMVRVTGMERRTPMAAASVVVFGACLALGIGVAAVTLANRALVPEIQIRGSIYYGVALAIISSFFGALGLLTSQISVTARQARGLGLAVLAAAYVARAIADVNEIAWLRALSPLGWRDVIGPYTHDRALPALGTALVVALVAALAWYVAGRRDLGAPWPARSDRAARGTRRYRGYGPLRLRLHLERSTITWWMIALLAISSVWGSISGDMGKVLDDSPQTRAYLEGLGGQGAAETVYLLAIGPFFAIVVACAVVYVAGSAHRDETAGILTGELASGICVRTAYWHSTLIAFVTAVLTSVLGALVFAAAADGATDVDVWDTAWWAGVSALPPAIAVLGLTVLLAGFLPRWTALAWAPVAVSGFMTFFGPLLDVPDWVQDLTLFNWAIGQQDGSLEWTGSIVLTACGVLLCALGIWAVGRRDLECG
ncbi:MAG: hypothetical protein Q4P36_02865 [Bowdeniella nasicola]|nr:hypothetical protein [Bowdeniella nasicola]